MLYQCTADMAEMKAKQENMIVDMDKVWTDMKNDQEDISERCALLEDLLKIMSKELARKPLTPAVPPQLHASRAADAHGTPRGRPAGSHDDPTPAAAGQGGTPTGRARRRRRIACTSPSLRIHFLGSPSKFGAKHNRFVFVPLFSR